jgi:large subunit ribosomal protein L22
MSKVTGASRRKENEAIAKGRLIKGSERKLNLLAQLIRGKKAQKALIELEFSRRRMARDVYSVLQAAIANAENNHNLDVDRLYVKEAIVGRTMTIVRFHTRGRGRSAKIEKPFANITIRLEERSGTPAASKEAAKGGKKKQQGKTAGKKSAEAKTA